MAGLQNQLVALCKSKYKYDMLDIAQMGEIKAHLKHATNQLMSIYLDGQLSVD